MNALIGSGEAKDAYGVSVWALPFERISCGTMKVRRLLEESFVKIQVPSGDHCALRKQLASNFRERTAPS